MKKKIVLLSLLLFLVPQILCACEIDESFGLEKSMLLYSTSQLKLTDNQQVLKNKINKTYNPLFNKKLYELGKTLDNSKDKNTSIKEFKVKEKELFEINKKYENEINAILTKKQKVQFSLYCMQSHFCLKQQLKSYLK